MSEPTPAPEATLTPEGQGTADGSGSSEPTEPNEQKQEPTGTEPPPEPEGAPEKYEFALPEGFPDGHEISAAMTEAYSEAARELNLPQEKAQKLFATTMTALNKSAVAEMEQQAEAWIKATREDPEIGGDNLDESLGLAKKAAQEFGSEAFNALLKIDSGIGDHPEWIRLLSRVGKAISEDRFVGGNQGGAVDPKDESAVARGMFPKSLAD